MISNAPCVNFSADCISYFLHLTEDQRESTFMVVQENPDFSDTQFFEPENVSYIWICFGQTQPPIF